MGRWVLLRGLARDRRHWGGFVDVFRAAFPGDEVLAIDLAGNGERSGETSPASVAGMVEDYRIVLAANGVDSPVNLLALSLGGMVAVEWAARYPTEVSRGVLVNTSVGGLCAIHRRLRPRQLGNIARLAVTSSAERAESIILRMTSAQPDPQLAKAWAAYRQLHVTRSTNAVRQLLAAANYRLPAETPASPFLLLASRTDQLVDIGCSRALARRYPWPLFEHPFAGHDLPLDDARWVVERVVWWIEHGAA